LPAALTSKVDAATLASLGDSRVLLNPASLESLKTAINDSAMFDQTVGAIRGSLEASLKAVFLIGAITMLLSLILIVTIPEVSMDAEVQDKGH
jgi:hypothetical protein